MKTKQPKQQLNVDLNPQYEEKQKNLKGKQLKILTIPKNSSMNAQNSPSPNNRDELKRVQTDIENMKSKVHLLRQQLQKQQDSIKMNKNRTQDVIKKKINVNKIQKYKQKDTSFDIERAQKLRLRNASLREAHQNEMQNILKAIYLVKLDDARQIKSLSKSYQQKIQQKNDQEHNHQLEKKKKIAEETQKAKQKYEKYWKQKLTSIYQEQNKNKDQIDRLMNQRRDELKELREEEVKLLQNMNKMQLKQLQTRKEYLAALSLPVKDVAEALKRSKSSLENINQKNQKQQKLSRMNSELVKSKKSESLASNFSGISIGNDSIFKDVSFLNAKQLKVPNSKVNKDKLKVILKQLKRLQNKQKSGIQKYNQ